MIDHKTYVWFQSYGSAAFHRVAEFTLEAVPKQIGSARHLLRQFPNTVVLEWSEPCVVEEHDTTLNNCIKLRGSDRSAQPPLPAPPLAATLPNCGAPWGAKE